MHCGLFCYNSDMKILHEKSWASKLRKHWRVWITLVYFKYQQCVMWWYTDLLLKGKMDRQQNLEGFIPSSTLIIKPRTDKQKQEFFMMKTGVGLCSGKSSQSAWIRLDGWTSQLLLEGVKAV